MLVKLSGLSGDTDGELLCPHYDTLVIFLKVCNLF